MTDRHRDEHDQPPPTANTSTPIIDLLLPDVTDPLVRADLLERCGPGGLGERRYGVLLQAHNGRDALRDAYEEALDLVMYLRQAWEEEANALERCVRIEQWSVALSLAIRLRRSIARREETRQ